MKSIKTIIAISLLSIGGILTACDTPAEKVEKAEQKVTEANNNLDSANKEYLEDITRFRMESNEKIAANNKSIAEFNIRIANQKKDARAEYKIKIDDLNKKNDDMKKRIDDYRASDKDNWQKFKDEFTHDMDELGKAFKDLTINNVK